MEWEVEKLKRRIKKLNRVTHNAVAWRKWYYKNRLPIVKARDKQKKAYLRNFGCAMQKLKGIVDKRVYFETLSGDNYRRYILYTTRNECKRLRQFLNDKPFALHLLRPAKHKDKHLVWLSTQEIIRLKKLVRKRGEK